MHTEKYFTEKRWNTKTSYTTIDHQFVSKSQQSLKKYSIWISLKNQGDVPILEFHKICPKIFT